MPPSRVTQGLCGVAVFLSSLKGAGSAAAGRWLPPRSFHRPPPPSLLPVQRGPEVFFSFCLLKGGSGLVYKSGP